MNKLILFACVIFSSSALNAQVNDLQNLNLMFDGKQISAVTPAAVSASLKAASQSSINSVLPALSPKPSPAPSIGYKVSGFEAGWDLFVTGPIKSAPLAGLFIFIFAPLGIIAGLITWIGGIERMAYPHSGPTLDPLGPSYHRRKHRLFNH